MQGPFWGGMGAVRELIKRVDAAPGCRDKLRLFVVGLGDLDRYFVLLSSSFVSRLHYGFLAQASG